MARAKQASLAKLPKSRSNYIYLLRGPPIGFKLSDLTLDSLGNRALDLGPNDLVDDAYIKRFRQRERHGAK